MLHEFLTVYGLLSIYLTIGIITILFVSKIADKYGGYLMTLLVNNYNEKKQCQEDAYNDRNI